MELDGTSGDEDGLGRTSGDEDELGVASRDTSGLTWAANGCWRRRRTPANGRPRSAAGGGGAPPSFWGPSICHGRVMGRMRETGGKVNKGIFNYGTQDTLPHRWADGQRLRGNSGLINLTWLGETATGEEFVIKLFIEHSLKCLWRKWMGHKLEARPLKFRWSLCRFIVTDELACRRDLRVSVSYYSQLWPMWRADSYSTIPGCIPRSETPFRQFRGHMQTHNTRAAL